VEVDVFFYLATIFTQGPGTNSRADAGAGAADPRRGAAVPEAVRVPGPPHLRRQGQGRPGVWIPPLVKTPARDR